MEIEFKEITVRELTKGYADNAGTDGSVVGYGGKLDIRPPYQREFIYKDKQRDAVIETINQGFPLNVMYWAVRDDGGFEVIDGQQRTISVCSYVNKDFSYKGLGFNNLQDDEQAKILDYKITVYLCSGTDSEKLRWFRTINIAGEKLTDQELRNAVYSGSWVTDAKRYFSKTGCAAYGLGSDYLKGSAIRQDYLETAIKWISMGSIDTYMAKHQQDANAGALWRYFQSVISWVQSTFPKKRAIMKGVDWGDLYNQYHQENLDANKLEKRIATFILDDDVTKKSGIYPYILTRDEKHLTVRAFTDAMKQKVYEKQKGICKKCKKESAINDMEADHITPWHEGEKRWKKIAKCYAKIAIEGNLESKATLADKEITVAATRVPKVLD